VPLALTLSPEYEGEGSNGVLCVRDNAVISVRWMAKRAVTFQNGIVGHWVATTRGGGVGNGKWEVVMRHGRKAGSEERQCPLPLTLSPEYGERGITRNSTRERGLRAKSAGLHDNNRPKPDLPLFDALVCLPYLVELISLRHDLHLAARGHRQRLV